MTRSENGRMTRRGVMGVALGAMILDPLVQPAKGGETSVTQTTPATRPIDAFVGCRTSRERNARGDGITEWTAGADGWSHQQTLTGQVNPSWLTLNAAGSVLYVAHGDTNEISSVRIGSPSAQLAPLNKVSCNGKNPVHLALSNGDRHLLVANHLTADGFVSNVAVFALGPDGSIGAQTDLVALSGKVGPHRVEQPFAKPHQIVFDSTRTFLIVPDKGLDVVHSFRLGDDGKLRPLGAEPLRVREGDGPRHAVFHPSAPFVFILNELSSTLIACRYDIASGALQPIQYLSALPDTFVGFSRASEIEISADGRFIYASNRGHDSIGIFAVEAATGRLSARDWVKTEGKTPRFITLTPDGSAVLAANEDSDTIVRFERKATTGFLTNPVIVARTGSPTSIVFLRPNG